jgi:thiol-disulfide isomerase/thioredoxin
VAVAGAVAVLVIAGIVGVAWLNGRQSAPVQDSAPVGAAVGDRAPDFRLTDIAGRTITAGDLRGRPALIWFTTSYCVPCQAGALALQRILGRIEGANALRVVVAFVDPGDPAGALTEWRSRFGRPDWIVGYADPSMIADYHVQALDTKFLLDRNGIVRVVDLVPIDYQEAAWERDLRSVIGG